MAWVQCGGKTYKLATINSNPVAKQCIAEKNKVKQIKHHACMEQPTCKAEYEAQLETNGMIAITGFIIIFILFSVLCLFFVKAVDGSMYLKDGIINFRKKESY